MHSEHRLEQVLRATDLLLESGGFGLIMLDLADLPPQSARRIPLTTWFRFRRAVEHKPTILLAIEQQPIAGSCSSLLLQLGPRRREREVQPRSGVKPRRKPWESRSQNPGGAKEIFRRDHSDTLTDPADPLHPRAPALPDSKSTSN